MAQLAPREIARDFIFLSSARIFSLGISFVRSLFIPRLLGPTSYGVWKSLGIVQSYMQFSDLGAIAALKREIPLLTSRGDEASLATARDVAFFVNHVVVLLAAIGLMAGSFFVPEADYARALRFFVLLLYARQVNIFLEKLLFWRKDFAYASRLNLVLAVTESTLAIGGTILFGIDGLIIGTFVGYGSVALLQLRRIGFDIGYAWKWSVYRELVKIGFPSHVNGLLYNLMTSIDRMLILPILGLEELGLYALAMTINDYLFMLSYALGNVLSPRLVETWSENESMDEIRPIVELPTLGIALAAPVVLGAVWFAVGSAIEVLLPRFTGAIVPLRILLVGTYFSSLHRGLSSFFLAIRKQGRLFPIYGGAILLNAGAVWSVLQAGYGIQAVAASTATVMGLFSFTMIVTARWFFREGLAGHLRFIALLVSPLAWAAVCVTGGTMAAGTATVASAGPIARSAAGLAVFGLLYAPMIYAGYRYLTSRSPGTATP